MRIRDPGWEKFASGINIQSPQHRFFRVLPYVLIVLVPLIIAADLD